jgi:cation/acetate symporter
MTTISQRRLINPRLGTYFGIFTSSFLAIVLLSIISEQLGLSDGLVRWTMLLGPLALYVTIGAFGFSIEPADYFVAGRRVPSAYSGLVLATAATGGTCIVAGTGIFFHNGYDAWCVVIGFSGGFVVMALMVAPYLRKFGAYTVPSYLGRRLDSRVVRLAAAAVFLVPILLVALAELEVALTAASLLTGIDRLPLALVLGAALAAAILPGGMRGLTWSSAAASIASLIALTVPVAIVAALVNNLPLPQLSHGPALRAIGRLEQLQGVPIPIAGAFSFDLAGTGFESVIHRLSAPYSSVGPVAFILAAMVFIAGVAGAPWLLPRCGTTPSVYESRKSIAWAAFFAGLILITVSSIGVFMRSYVMDGLVMKTPAELPAWFLELVDVGFAAFDSQASRFALGSFSFKRDTVLYALPQAAGFPSVMVYLALAGAVAAGFAAAASSLTTMGQILAEDVLVGLYWDAPAQEFRLNIARISTAAVIGFTLLLALLFGADPLQLLLWALTISASACFPALVVSVWWKRANPFGVMIGMATGLGTAVLAIIAGEAGLIGLPSELAGVVGLPAALIAIAVATWMRPQPGPRVMELVRDMRLPGGEAIYDREVRLQKLKSRQRS